MRMDDLMQDCELTLPAVFRRAERMWSTKSMVTATPGGRVRQTYGEWAERTRRLGGALDQLGLGPGARVATMSWNSAAHLELYYAAPCSGRVLHTLNPRLFADQLTYIVNHAEDEVAFVDAALLPTLWPLVDQMPTLRHVVVMPATGPAPAEVPDDPRVVDYEELVAAGDTHPFSTVTDERAAAAMCYTSGTTGNPKGVVYTHRSQVLHGLMCLQADTLAISEADVILPAVPMFHANAWGMGQAGVMAGSTYVFPGAGLGPAALADLVVEEGVTVALGVPTVWLDVASAMEGRDTSALQRIICGGSAVPRSLGERYRTSFGVTVIQAWGMTETSPIATVARVRSDHAGAGEGHHADLRATQGLAVPLVELRLTEPDTGAELPWDGQVTGEVQVRAPWAAATYYDDARSSESFAPDGWLRTGDIASISPDGYVRLVDRTKDLIKSGGEWISSVELENELMGHPRIREAAVIGVPHPRWQERPLACVVVEGDAPLGEAEVLEWLAPRVARWWLPDRVVFIDEVPRTSVGKFSKRALRERFASGVAEPGGG